MRVYNFSAGPAVMPEPVLSAAAAELTDWQGSGMSVLEVSHRGPDFVACAAEAEGLLRELLDIPANYRVLFLQGGATAQLAAVPMNLTAPGDPVGYLNTGHWSGKAIAQARRYGLRVSVAADEADSRYTTLPTPDAIKVDPSWRYLHYTPNETIGGVEFDYIPDTGEIPLVADMSSTILSRPVEVSRFGVIYAGAQKNMGPAGLTVVIVREDLLGRARDITPPILDWQAMASTDSMLNTPPTFAIYLLGKILHWLHDLGGLSEMAKLNQAKAALLYSAIDDSDFYTNPVARNARSWMNVPFTLADSDLDSAFLAAAEQAGLTNLKGHRSVGGMRASIYNAMPLAGVEALIEQLHRFAANHG
ncbi:MAG: 3-phosphoserine/phosphohydroxythreonine aminotransferase [Arachnia propionica]|nr:MAG: 3-phosphoserine/phosphohydroxythreonine aminotransferase [Arachnia propionica]